MVGRHWPDKQAQRVDFMSTQIDELALLPNTLESEPRVHWLKK